MYIDHVVCQFSPRYTTNGSCKLNFITRLQKSVTINSFVTKVIETVTGHVQLYYKFRNGYKLFLVNVKTDMCDYTSGKAPSKLMDYIMPAVNKYSVRNLTCPYSGWIRIKELPINGAIFDYVFLPVGNYMLNLTLFTAGNHYMWNSKFYFIIPEGKTIEDDRMGR